MNKDASSRAPYPARTSKVKDAQLIFAAVWDDLLKEHGRDQLCFPREFIWLGGAPGAGKGTNTPFIAKMRDITAPPIVISDLLTIPGDCHQERWPDGGRPRRSSACSSRNCSRRRITKGVIVDGFPRTKVQVECLKIF